MMNPTPFSADIREFLMELARHHVHYLIVGGEAVIYYGHARLTGDIDIYYDNSPENSCRLYDALADFWQGIVPGISSAKDLQKNNQIIQFGVPPHRIDLLSTISAVDFHSAWENRVTERIKLRQNEFPVFYIGLKQLIQNKQAVKRPRDIEDLEFLTRIKNPSG
jgi:hypothetical protein